MNLYLTRKVIFYSERDADENDLLYDDIACGMLIKKMQYEKRELLESLEMFYRVFFLGEDGQ